MRNHSYIFLIAAMLLSILLYSCANIGTPSGGPRDEDPPRFVSSNPAPDALNFHGQRVEISFNELVNVKDAFSKVTVSPPSQQTPRVSSSGRKVYVQFPDTLCSNTTYTIDFANSIEDNNEGNPLGRFSLTFSTGPDLDSLRISGIALDAYTLEPQQSMLIGVHPADAPDSALTTLRFSRITRTDDRGRFTLRGLKGIPYNLFALGDLNNDMRRDNPAELLGFYPRPIIPYCESALATDTIYNTLTGATDTIVERSMTRFLPDNILLSVFDEGYKPQYLTSYERPDSAKLRFIFNAPADTLPAIKFLNFSDSPAFRLEHSAKLDTLTYWLTDPRMSSLDTLSVALSYNLVPVPPALPEMRADSLMLNKPKVKIHKGKRNKQQLKADSIAEAKARLLAVNITPSGTLEIYQRPVITFAEPVTRLDSTMVHLEVKQDTLWVPMELPPLRTREASASRVWELMLTPRLGDKYKLTLDSLAVTSVYGKSNAGITAEFGVKNREDYASLTLRLVPDTIPGFVEILSSDDKPVMRERVNGGIVHFPWLAPSEYYARFIADADSSMTFTPGDYLQRRQPEDVYYYPSAIDLKRHDRSEQWNLYGTPVDKQKPLKITRNKPEADKRRRATATEEGTTEEDDEIFDVNSNPFLKR